MPPVIDKDLCNYCGTCGICYDICPQDVFIFDKKQEQVPAIAYPQECWYCGFRSTDPENAHRHRRDSQAPVTPEGDRAESISAPSTWPWKSSKRSARRATT